jgi:3',5'-cyclic AMP phosphodiesterase CpdA
MVVSLVIVAFQPSEPAATPTPTEAPLIPTEPPTPTEAPPSPSPSPTAEPEMGPVAPTAFPSPEPSLTLTPTLTPLPTATPSAAQPGFTFAVAGDSRDNEEVYQSVLASVAASEARFLIHTGDMVNRGTAGLWEAFRQSMAGFSLPFYPVPGNHDGLLGKLDGYLAASGAPAAHYSFYYGLLHFAMADSHNGGVGASELAWLRNDLEATSQPVKIVVLHHPPFDPDGTDHIMAYGNDKFMSLMVQEGVRYVFAGHIHAYAQAEREGVAYIYTGGGGAELYAGHPEAYHHYLLVTVAGEELAVEVVRV